MKKIPTLHTKKIQHETYAVLFPYFPNPNSFVFCAHAFQTAKRCDLFKKFIYESCFKKSY
jgi:hypothetical protein